MATKTGRLTKRKGYLALVGEDVDFMAQKWLERHRPEISDHCAQQRHDRDGGDEYHITVVNTAQLKALPNDALPLINDLLGQDLEVLGAGVGATRDSQVWYLACYCPQAEHFRARLGLEPADFHITLGFQKKDVHDVRKGFSTLPLSNPEPVAAFGSESLRLLKLAEQLSDGKELLPGTLEYATYLADVITRTPAEAVVGDALLSTARGLARFCSARRPLAEPASALGYWLLDQGALHGLAALLACHVREGAAAAGPGSGAFPVDAVLGALCLPRTMRRPPAAGGGGGGGLWRRALRAFNAEMIPFKQEKHARALAFDPTTGALDLSPLPRNFGWVVDGRVAGCAIPTLPAHLAALRGVGVARVITIHEQPLPAPLPAAAAAQGVDLRHFPCDDRAPPAPAQLAAIVALMAEAVEAGEAVAVHCQGGVGRTATALAAYLVRAEGLSAAEALARLTARRKVLVTEAQTAALRAWWRAEQDAAALGSAAGAETKEEEEEAVAATATAAEGGAPDPAPAAAPPPAPRRPAVKLPRLILLCGLAASGKSTFAQALVDSFPDRVARVNKDEMRGKGEVDAAFAAAARRGLTVVVDMCNLTAEKRRAWAAAAWGPGAAWLVELATAPGACQYRAARRAGHPTLPPRRARGVIEAQARQYEPPTAEEGFAELIRLETEEAAAALLEEWGAAPPRVAPLDAQLVKFPRTHHAVNLGAATRDDRVLPEGDLRALLAAGGGGGRTLVVEEKLDGANMGLSIGRDGAVRAQNRSHFVTSGYHAQFKPLDKWLQQHTGDLWDVLQPEEHPERYILYGEWLHATHSVKYTRLPGWFVAFDLYDRRAEKFLGRGELARRLRGTRLPLAPLVHEGPLDLGREAPAAFLRRLAHGPSAVTDGRREGVVLKVLGPDGRLEARAKVVREDFIAGNERWDRAAKLEVNQLDPEVFCG